MDEVTFFYVGDLFSTSHLLCRRGTQGIGKFCGSGSPGLRVRPRKTGQTGFFCGSESPGGAQENRSNQFSRSGFLNAMLHLVPSSGRNGRRSLAMPEEESKAQSGSAIFIEPLNNDP